MEVTEYICKLLLWHDKVIIPGFGSLQATYAPATIHPTQHLFRPPHKSLSFDKNVAIQDDLLIVFIANSERINYESARRKVARFVTDAEDDLVRKGSYLAPGIGKFFYDIEKQQQFIADDTNNFLLNSYGLNDFISPPVLRPENIRNYTQGKVKPAKKKRRFIWFRF